MGQYHSSILCCDVCRNLVDVFWGGRWFEAAVFAQEVFSFILERLVRGSNKHIVKQYKLSLITHRLFVKLLRAPKLLNNKKSNALLPPSKLLVSN